MTSRVEERTTVSLRVWRVQNRLETVAEYCYNVRWVGVLLGAKYGEMMADVDSWKGRVVVPNFWFKKRRTNCRSKLCSGKQ